MNNVKNLTKRFAMTVLFSMALFVTFQTISGVDATTLFSYLGIKIENQQKEAESSFHPLKSVKIAFKNLEQFVQNGTHIYSSRTASEVTPSLENAFDWTKYPAKTVVATGYTAGFESTGKYEGHPEYGITFSGVKVKRDLYSTVAADLRVFPIGTILFIPGYGYGVVADKGGAIKGNELDLYYETVADVYKQWGKKQLNVYVIKMGNGNLTEEQLKALNENKAMQVFRQQYFNSERR